MPGGAVDVRKFPSIKEFQDALREEEAIWTNFPSFGKNPWTPSACFQQFTGETNKRDATPTDIEKTIDQYYSRNGAPLTYFYPSWTLAGRIICQHRNDNQFLDGFATALGDNRNLVLNTAFGDSKISVAWLQGLAAGQILSSGLSTSSSENAIEEMQIIRAQHAQLMKEAVESKYRMEKLYNEKLHLEASVTYWGAKAVEHERKKRFWMGSIVGWSVILLVVLGAYLKWGGKFYTETIKIFVDEQWSFVCGFLILASFVYWIIRFVVSQYNQHNHLATDARERETMVETFLALVNDEKAQGTVTEKDHLVLVLAALFRPSAIGGCENGPVPFYETIANTLSKK